MLRAGSRPPPYAAVSIHCSPSLLASFGQIIWIKKAPLCAIMPGQTPPPSVARIKLFGARHEREPEGKGRSSRSSTLYLLLSGRIGCHFFPCRRGERAQSRGVTCPARSTELRANQTPKLSALSLSSSDHHLHLDCKLSFIPQVRARKTNPFTPTIAPTTVQAPDDVGRTLPRVCGTSNRGLQGSWGKLRLSTLSPEHFQGILAGRRDS